MRVVEPRHAAGVGFITRGSGTPPEAVRRRATSHQRRRAQSEWVLSRAGAGMALIVSRCCHLSRHVITSVQFDEYELQWHCPGMSLFSNVHVSQVAS